MGYFKVGNLFCFEIFILLFVFFFIYEFLIVKKSIINWKFLWLNYLIFFFIVLFLVNVKVELVNYLYDYVGCVFFIWI